MNENPYVVVEVGPQNFCVRDSRSGEPRTYRASRFRADDAALSLWDREKAAKPVRRPYTSASIQIVDRGPVVTALYIPDAVHAKDPGRVLDDLLNPQYENVEVVATAERYLKKSGASFSGWVVRSGLDYSDPIRTKPEAMGRMRIAIVQYFSR